MARSSWRYAAAGVVSPAILCLLWRPSGAVIRDGGFRRTYSILKAWPPDLPVTVVDRYPTMCTDGRFRVIEYQIPKPLAALSDKGVRLARALEVLVAFSFLLVLGSQVLYGTRLATVYVPTSEIPWVTIAASLLAKVFRTRLVLANLNTRIGLASIAGGLVGRVLWRIHSHADQVIALSSAIAEELKVVGVSTNVAINTCGFDQREDASRDRAIPEHAGIYVGRVESAKGIDDLLDAWLIVTRSHPMADLRVAGHANPDNRAKFIQRRDSIGLEHAVELLGVVTDEAKWDLYGESRVCIFLSRVEGWGFVPLEALSSGIPVVVYDLPCYRESLQGLDGVLGVAVGDIAGAARHIDQLLAMEAGEYMALSDRIRESFTYPDWSQVASTELALIRG